MTKLKKKNDTKRRSKMRILSLLLAVVFVLSQGIALKEVSAANKIYVDQKMGDNKNSGDSPEEAVKSFKKARKLLDEKGVIYIKKDGKWIPLKGKALDKATKIDEEAILDDVNDKEVDVTPTVTNTPEAPKVTEEPIVTEAPMVTEAPTITEKPIVIDAPTPTPTPTANGNAQPTPTPDMADIVQPTPTPAITDDVQATPTPSPLPEVTGEEPSPEINNQDVSDDETFGGEISTEDAPGGLEANVQGEEKLELPMTGEITAVELNDFLEQVTFMLQDQLDINNIYGATLAYDALDDEAKSQLPEALYKRLRAAQLVIGENNKVSNGIRVDGDLPWYVEFRATYGNNKGGGTFDLGDLVGSYELTLWNTLTNEPYKLNGASVTVTIPVDNAIKYKNISVIHYLEDGSVEVLTPTRVEGENAISFVTTSFSPYSVAGNVLAGGADGIYDKADKSSESNKDKPSNSNSDSNSKGTSNKSAGANTGDDNNVALMIGLGGGAIAVIIGLIVVKKKKKRDE